MRAIGLFESCVGILYIVAAPWGPYIYRPVGVGRHIDAGPDGAMTRETEIMMESYNTKKLLKRGVTLVRVL